VVRELVARCSARHRTFPCAPAGLLCKPHLTPGKTLMFAHGFSVVFKEQTGVVPPPGIDVVLVAPKGSGTYRALPLPRGPWHRCVHRRAPGRVGQGQGEALMLGSAVGVGYM